MSVNDSIFCPGLAVGGIDIMTMFGGVFDTLALITVDDEAHEYPLSGDGSPSKTSLSITVARSLLLAYPIVLMFEFWRLLSRCFCASHIF